MDSMQQMPLLTSAHFAQPGISKTKIRQTSTLARYAPRENVNTKQDKQAAIVAIPANIQTRQDILNQTATYVGKENTHQLHLLAAKTAHWGNIRTKPTLIKPRATSVKLVDMLMIRQVHLLQANLPPVKVVQLVGTRARVLPLLTAAFLVRQACMSAVHLNLVRLAPQASSPMLL